MTAEYGDQRLGGALDLGYAISRRSEIRLGYLSTYQKLWPQIGDREVIPTLSGRIGTSRLRYTYTSLDDPAIPRRGVAVQARGQWFDASPGTTAGFPLGELSVWAFKRISKPSSLLFSASGGSTFGHSETGLPPFILGGPATLAAYGTNELIANQYFLFRAGYLRELAKLSFMGDKLYLIAAAELGKVYDMPEVSRLPTSVMGALMVNTMLGPAQFGAAYGDRGHHRFFFSLGRIF